MKLFIVNTLALTFNVVKIFINIENNKSKMIYSHNIIKLKNIFFVKEFNKISSEADKIFKMLK